MYIHVSHEPYRGKKAVNVTLDGVVPCFKQFHTQKKTKKQRIIYRIKRAFLVVFDNEFVQEGRFLKVSTIYQRNVV
jgi:hypothetical protein